MYRVNQPWDPLEVCVVGRCYDPDFFDWIEKPHVRTLFRRIVEETQEDFENIVDFLQSHGVKVLRPDLPVVQKVDDKFVPPPMTPRDFFIMIDDVFWTPDFSDVKSYFERDGQDCWADDQCIAELPQWIQRKSKKYPHAWQTWLPIYQMQGYDNIVSHIKKQGNLVVSTDRYGFINGACCSRIGKDLYFSTQHYGEPVEPLADFARKQFPQYRTHVINTGGHADGTYCPVSPGLIISLYDVPTYEKTFPGWEVLYLPNQSWNQIKPFLDLKQKNAGKWWIPGFEYDQDVVNLVEVWLENWVGYVEETVFDVNMLVLDPETVLAFNTNPLVESTLARRGIKMEVLPFRHRYFWDGGIHCVTLDLHRQGTRQDFFEQRD